MSCSASKGLATPRWGYDAPRRMSTGRRQAWMRMGSCLLGLTVVALLVGGCGAPQSADPDEVRLITVWRAELDRPDQLEYGAEQPAGVAVSSAAGVLIVPTAGRAVHGVETGTGQVRWTLELAEPVVATPAVDGRDAFLVVPDGRVIALDAISGAVRWSVATGGHFYSTPLVTDDRVVVVGANDALYALSRDDGTVAFTFERPRQDGITMRGQSTPTALDDGSFVAGFADGSFFRLSASGEIVWSADLSGDAARFVDVDGRAVVWSDLVIASSFNGGVYALGRDDGEVRWQRDLQGARLAIGPTGRLFAVTASGQVMVLDPGTGSVLWELGLSVRGPAEPVFAGRSLLVGTREMGIYVVDTGAPRIRSRFAPGSGFSAAPTVLADRVYAISDGGVLYRLELERIPTGIPIF